MYLHLRNAILLFICALSSACVSLSLETETEVSKDLYFAEPGGNFKQRSAENLDGYFVEQNSGNSISIKSACYDPADPSLSTLENSAFGGMTVIKEIKRENTKFSKRAALRSKKLVKIDGVAVLVEMMIFKKNNCNYLISHVGVEENFKQTSLQYNAFLKTVRAP